MIPGTQSKMGKFPCPRLSTINLFKTNSAPMVSKEKRKENGGESIPPLFNKAMITPY